MVKNLNLNEIGLYPLTNEEFLFIDAGGVPWKKIWDGTKWVVEKAGIVDFFSDVWDGIKEGYHDARS